MRKLVLQMGVSVDGYVAGGPEEAGQSGPPGEHPEVTAWKLDQLRKVGLHIMGRVTYEQMAVYWPAATNPYATLMNDLPKVVFSKTLTTADWANSRIARGDLAEEIERLKEEPGGEIMVHGGAAFVQDLSRLRQIDEYHLVIGPVALGSGLPMFKDLASPLRFKLAQANTFPDGTIIPIYRTVV